MSAALAPLVRTRLAWDAWEHAIGAQGITIDRPHGSAHPRYPEIIYPIDYGYVNDTRGTDGDGLDLFVGTTEVGLVGLILTRDYRQGDREAKLLYRCGPEEVYRAHGFINYDRSLLEGILVLRYPMREIWEMAGGG